MLSTIFSLLNVILALVGFAQTSFYIGSFGSHQYIYFIISSIVSCAIVATLGYYYWIISVNYAKRIDDDSQEILV